MSDSPAAAGTVICLTDPPITNFYNILTGHHLAEALTEWRELMWGTSRSEQCKERTAAEALFALPIFLGLTIQRTAADYQHLCAKAFFQICGRGFCLAQHPGSARDLTSSGSSPQAITDQLVSKHPIITQEGCLEVCVHNSISENFPRNWAPVDLSANLLDKAAYWLLSFSLTTLQVFPAPPKYTACT